MSDDFELVRDSLEFEGYDLGIQALERIRARLLTAEGERERDTKALADALAETVALHVDAQVRIESLEAALREIAEEPCDLRTKPNGNPDDPDCLGEGLKRELWCASCLARQALDSTEETG